MKKLAVLTLLCVSVAHANEVSDAIREQTFDQDMNAIIFEPKTKYVPYPVIDNTCVYEDTGRYLVFGKYKAKAYVKSCKDESGKYMTNVEDK